MSFDADKLYELLPAVYRLRDAEQAGQPLKQLVALMAGQVAVLEEHLEQLYENHFVETAAPWALPYVGDLLGIRGLLAGKTAGPVRAELGHTVAYRRRKGTAPMLELLARDVTGLPARAVEFFERIAATQHLNHLRADCQSSASLRNAKQLEFVGTPFESLRRSVEVRRIEVSRGKWNIPNVGLFLWRLRAYPRTASPVVGVGALRAGDPRAARRFRFHPFGMDAPLYSQPLTEDKLTQLAEPINVALPITRRMLSADSVTRPTPNPLLYGPGLSVLVQRWTPERNLLGTLIPAHYEPIPANQVIVCDLSDARDDADQPVWNHEQAATEAQVAIDPVLGRMVLGRESVDPKHLPRVTSHYGFSFDLGGGEYGRAGSFEADQPATRQVPHSADSPLPSFDTIAEALNSLGNHGGSIVIKEGGRFVEQLPEVNANGASIEIRGEDGRCPVVLPRPGTSGQPWTMRGDHDGRISLNGLWLAGPLRVAGPLGKLTLRHCTLAPGREVQADGQVVAAADTSFVIDVVGTQVSIENCILPSLRVADTGVHVHLRNCIVDAGAEEKFALSNLPADGPAGTWRLENCTIVGSVALDVLEIGSNCIFLGESVFVQRRQEGCTRFSWLPAIVRAPRRYRCLPTEPVANAALRPHFASLRWGDPAYAQLSRRCPEAVRVGADDGAEMGAFHDLFQPQREAHLRARLMEYLRFGLEAGVLYES